MSKSKPPRKPPAGPKKGRGPTIYVRLPQEVDAALETFRARQRVQPERPAVAVQALREFLSREGFLADDRPAS